MDAVHQDSWSRPTANSLPPTPPQNTSQKKPRHRHSPAQLAALNELFDKNEHPPLDVRTALAERLGMETKTVNAWFQNKRASSKKRARNAVSDVSPVNPAPGVYSSDSPSNPHHLAEFDDFHDEEYSSIDMPFESDVPSESFSSFYSGSQDHTFFLDSDTMPRRMRMRPTTEQTEELKKLYNINPHPTTEQRQVLSRRIGMRYQSVANWFQNQRSLAKKKKEDEIDMCTLSSSRSGYRESRQYSAFPPPSHHPSLVPPQMPYAPTYPFSVRPAGILRSPSVSPSMEDYIPRRSFGRSSVSYGGPGTTFSRPRRSRPEPFQLDALKDLFTKTPTPTIEERSALALEIGMDVGKVTNWFRNLRQTARKRSKRSGSADDDDYDGFSGRISYSAFDSHFGTPSFGSSSSSLNDESMDLEPFDYDMHSDIGSEDEFQEAVTPSPEASPSPPPPPSNSHLTIEGFTSFNEPAYYAEFEKRSATYSDIKFEDALLLLSFHQHSVH